MRTNLPCCLGAIDNDHNKTPVPCALMWHHENPGESCMLLPKALKLRSIKDTMVLVAGSIGGTCAGVVVPGAFRSSSAQSARKTSKLLLNFSSPGLPSAT